MLPETLVMNQAARIDVLIIRQEDSAWTAEQLERSLPAGIRQCTARYILLKFKYTQSINDDALHQSLAYDFLYR